MPYNLQSSVGNIEVIDGQLNTTSTSLSLPGRNYAGYGAPVVQNWISLVENFANSGTTGPANPLPGQLWWDKSTQELKIYKNDRSIVKVLTAGSSASLDSLTVGDLAVTRSADLGQVANVSIGGGLPGQILSTSDGAGGLAWINPPTSSGPTGTNFIAGPTNSIRITADSISGNSTIDWSPAGVYPPPTTLVTGLVGTGGIAIQAPVSGVGPYVIDGSGISGGGGGGGSSPVYQAGSGIGISGNVITNTGATQIVAGTNISITSSGGGGTGSVTINATGGGGGGGGVSLVDTAGGGLGFNLSGGPIITSGTVTLTTPSSTSLRTSLGIGNVANANFNGVSSQVLSGTGDWINMAGGGGTTGSNGQSVYTAAIYRADTGVPLTPTGGTYTFVVSGGGVNLDTSGLSSGWVTYVPDTAGTTNNVYISTRTFSTNTPTVPTATGSWSFPVLAYTQGQTGQTGISTYNWPIYRRSATVPETPTAGQQWNFSTASGTPPTDWFINPPNGTDQLYISYATVSSASSPSGRVDSWSAPAPLAQAGTSGTNGVSLYSYAVFKSDAGTPDTPTGGQYNFSNQTGSPPTNWYNDANAANVANPTGNIWVSTSTASAQSPVTIDTSLAWTIPVRFNGSNGSDGYTTIVRPVYAASQTNPGTPTTGGSVYNFGTNTLTPPNNWFVNPQPGWGGLTIWSSQATFRTLTPTANQDVPPLNPGWTPPGIISTPGSDGPAGPRGFIPLAFITVPTGTELTTAATGNVDQSFTDWFAAPRATPGGTIGGLGTSPQDGDAAQFYSVDGTNVTVVREYNGGRTPKWQNIYQYVMSGNVVATGSITAAQMKTNELYALKLKSTNSTWTDANGGDGPADSPGFWINGQTGNARFGGSVSIGANGTFGGNLVAAGGTFSGNLSAAGGTFSGNLSAAGGTFSGNISASQVATGTLVADRIPTITSDKISATQLSAITSTTGSLNIIGASNSVAELTIGGPLTIDGTQPGTLLTGGSGAKFHHDPGTAWKTWFVMGNPTTNITFRGFDNGNAGRLYLNGDVVFTNNIQSRAVTVPASLTGTGTVTIDVPGCIAGQPVLLTAFLGSSGDAAYESINGSTSASIRLSSPTGPVLSSVGAFGTGTGSDGNGGPDRFEYPPMALAAEYIPPSDGTIRFSASGGGTSGASITFIALQVKR